VCSVASVVSMEAVLLMSSDVIEASGQGRSA
jgi:hypothetical protein